MKKILLFLVLLIHLSSLSQLNLTIDYGNRCPYGWALCDGWVEFDFSDVIDNGDYTVYLCESSMPGSYNVLDSMIFTGISGFGSFDSLCPVFYQLLLTNSIGDTISSGFGPIYAPTPTMQILDSTAINGTLYCQFPFSGTLSPPYEYSMDNGWNFQPSNVFTGLAPGPYPTNIFIGKSAHGCLFQVGPVPPYAYVTAIPNTCNLQITASSTSATTYQTADGTINWSFTTDMPAFAHTITLQGPSGILGTQNVAAGISSGSFTNVLPLLVGDYSIWVKNSNDCYSSAAINIDFPIAGTNDFTHSCNPCDGLSTVHIYESPLQGPYSVKVYDVTGTLPVLAYTGVTISQISYIDNICAGDYAISIKNSLGDSTLLPFDNTYEQVNIIITNVENTTPGNSNGVIDVVGNLGAAPYFYSFGITGPWQSINSYPNLSAGNYTLYVIDSLGCKASTDTTVLTILNFDELKNNDFYIYPNPSNDVVYIKCDGEFSIVLTDLKGSILNTFKATNQTMLNVKELAAGIYILTVQNQHGKQTQKLIVD